jgi:hypothetical protein
MLLFTKRKEVGMESGPSLEIACMAAVSTISQLCHGFSIKILIEKLRFVEIYYILK